MTHPSPQCFGRTPCSQSPRVPYSPHSASGRSHQTSHTDPRNSCSCTGRHCRPSMRFRSTSCTGCHLVLYRLRRTTHSSRRTSINRVRPSLYRTYMSHYRTSHESYRSNTHPPQILYMSSTCQRRCQRTLRRGFRGTQSGTGTRQMYPLRCRYRRRSYLAHRRGTHYTRRRRRRCTVDTQFHCSLPCRDSIQTVATHLPRMCHSAHWLSHLGTQRPRYNGHRRDQYRQYSRLRCPS
jgi:hypothetical protein